MSRLLAESGHEVIVTHPRQLKLITESSRKCDPVDAETLARLAQTRYSIGEALLPSRHSAPRAIRWPRVLNVDKNPAYPAAVRALKAEGTLPRRVRLRQCRYLNNVVEQDHRFVKKRVWLAKGYGSFQSAWRTLQGIEAMHMIRKGRVRWLSKGDALGQAFFICRTIRRLRIAVADLTRSASILRTPLASKTWQRNLAPTLNSTVGI